MTRIPAATRRFTCAMASSGFVANASFPGMRAFARRCGSFAQQSGMYTSKSTQACPSAVTRAANTQVTQFSTFPVTPACCGDTHALDFPFRRSAVSSNASPGPMASSGSSRRTSCARPGSSPRASSHDHLLLLSRACIRCGPSCPASRASSQQFARVSCDSARM
jgi:hypothetical protein